MGRTLVVGDIHGAAKALQQCLDRCNFDYENDLLITLGDIVDGWSDVHDAVEILLKAKNRIDIMGNHDDWFVQYIKTGVHTVEWKQGGNGTRNSYLRAIGKEGMSIDSVWGHISALNPGDVPESHKQLFLRQIFYYTSTSEKNGTYCFVHGGFDRDYPIDIQSEYVLMWDRELWDKAKSCHNTKLRTVDDFSKIFIGHTHVDGWRNPNALPMNEGGIWNLDTGAGWSGKLTIMDADTEEFWQSDFVTELYPDEKGRRQ